MNNKKIMSLFKKIELFFLDTQKVFTVSFSPLSILAFVFFFSFGVYGYSTNLSYGWLVSSLLTGGFLVIFLALYFLKEKYETFTFVLTRAHVRLFFLHTVVLIAVTFPYIFLPMSGDNFYHTQQAFVYGIKSIEKVTPYVPFLSAYSFASLLQLASLLLILVAVGVVYLLRKTSMWVRVAVYGLSFILLRTAVLYFGGNTSAFPPFRLLPLFLSGSFFGIHEFSFRVASLVLVSALSVYLFNEIRKEKNIVLSWIAIVSIATTPLLLHVGTLVESSVVAFVATTFVLLRLSAPHLTHRDYGVLSLIIATASAMRVSTFLLFLPLVLHFLLHKKISREELISFVKAVAPASVVTACMIIVSFVQGSPASYGGEAYPTLGIGTGASFVEMFTQAFSGGYIYTALYNSLHIPLVLPLALFFLLKRQTLIMYGVFFSCSVALFFSISPGLWGNGRYQAEYFLPMVVVSLVVLFTRMRYIATAIFASILIIYNLTLFYSLPELNKDLVGYKVYFDQAKERGKYFVLSEMPFEYREPLIYFKEKAEGGNVYYMPGDGYSYMTKIISGYSLSEMNTERHLREEIGSTYSTTTYTSIVNNKTITSLIIHRAKDDPLFSNERFMKDLDPSMWKLEKVYTSVPYGNLTEVYTRSI